jgi:hypothetical protein
MFIELTNASEGFEGRPIAIKIDIITSVYEAKISKPEDEKTRYGTFVFSHLTQSNWQVKEKVSKVLELLNNK